MRDFQLPGRSPLRVCEAAVATSQPLASLTAVEVLRDGGNAVDAAVAAAAVLAVVEPQASGVGGDCFMLLAPKGGSRVIAFNGSGRAPRRARVEWYREQGFDSIPTYGPHSVTVPGAVDAWDQIVKDWGTRDLNYLLQPAIRYAEEGYLVGDRIAFDWIRCSAQLAANSGSQRIMLPLGKTPAAGDKHRQPELANTLRAIAKNGRDGFYKGSVVVSIVDFLQSLGGLHSIEDFLEARGEYVEPLRANYRGVEICQMPPNNQGLTALLMLNILSGFNISKLDPLGADRMHLEIEAGRLAYRERDAHIADTTHVDVPIERLLTPQFAGELRNLIDPERANIEFPNLDLEQSDTTYLCVVDRDCNAVSFINSLFHPFGSGIADPGSGVVLQNRGAGFQVDPDHPNCIAPGKRPMHTIMPGMAVNKGQAVMPFGVMGGDYQPFGHVHLIANLFDFGMDPQAALDSPRVFPSSSNLEVERGVPQKTQAGLQAKGHHPVTPDKPLGGGQAIVIDWGKGTLTAGSDPRKDGCALGY